MDLRASDADREHTADFLRENCADGRITHEELEDRVEAAYGATTVSELDELVRDLPAPVRTPPPLTRRRGSRVERLPALAPLAIPGVICTVIWALTDPGGYFWPGWVFLPLIIRLIILILDDRGDVPDPPAPPGLPPAP